MNDQNIQPAKPKYASCEVCKDSWPIEDDDGTKGCPYCGAPAKCIATRILPLDAYVED